MRLALTAINVVVKLSTPRRLVLIAKEHSSSVSVVTPSDAFFCFVFLLLSVDRLFRYPEREFDTANQE